VGTERNSGRRPGIVAIAICVTAMLSGLAAASGAAEPGPTPLAPDLVVLPVQQDDLIVNPERGGLVLRFAAEIANLGNGPLEVSPSEASSDCDGDGDPANDRDTSQRMFADSNANGRFDRGTDAVYSERRFGCMRYHAAHEHWHVLDIASYVLRREPGRAGVAANRKVGYCLSDGRLAFPGRATPETAAYPFGPPGSEGCDAAATEGISVGWSDVYGLALPGQDLEITGLGRGGYCLVIRADPDGLLEEVDETDNVRRVHLRLRPNALLARKLQRPCRS
jgi:lysyl oxidase